jgi:hypothetical protein
LSAQQCFDEASALYRRSLFAKQNILGQANADVAVTLHDWAVLCERAGLVEQARRLWAEAEAVATSVQLSEPSAGKPVISDAT